LEILKFAAVDIGSNAVRLLFMNVIEDNQDVVFRKSELVRMPVRLGEDAFYREGIIGPEKVEKLVHTMTAFKHLMIVQDVVRYRVCATSAMREATNSTEIINYIKERTGLAVEVIDGQQEAELVYSNRIVELINEEKSYLYVDVGGGSTEITLFSNKEVISSGSFNIGTIRFLNGDISNMEFVKMKLFLTELTKRYKPIELIGSGGNINKVFKLSGNKEGVPLSLKKLKTIFSYIESFTIDERIRVLGFNPDRADVIIPATQLFLKIMKWTRAKKILIPKIGISDGIVHQLYNSYRLDKTGVQPETGERSSI
jgi:exopolyphosphatase / guanosine-5'-triphosphate,3'-diphosphate pyrophosphatase